MKNTLTLLVFLLTPFCSFSQIAVDSVDMYQLEGRDDLSYKKGSETPYTGAAYTWYENGKMEFEANFVNGKIEGLATGWYPNGKMESETNYVNGKREGYSTTWHENGEKKGLVNFVNEVANEVTHADSVNIKQIEKRDDLSYKNGSETPYTGAAYAWKNGILLFMETNLVSGKPDGLTTLWDENGQKKEELNYKDGKREGLSTSWHDNGQKKEEVNFKDGKEVSRKEWDEEGNEIKN